MLEHLIDVDLSEGDSRLELHEYVVGLPVEHLPLVVHVVVDTDHIALAHTLGVGLLLHVLDVGWFLLSERLV